MLSKITQVDRTEEDSEKVATCRVAEVSLGKRKWSLKAIVGVGVSQNCI